MSAAPWLPVAPCLEAGGWRGRWVGVDVWRDLCPLVSLVLQEPIRQKRMKMLSKSSKIQLFDKLAQL